MQLLLFPKTGRPSLRAAHVRLPLTAAITAVLVLVFFSTGAHSGSGTNPMPASCAAALLTNGSFELPTQTSVTDPLNWSISQWISSSQLIRDDANAHSGGSSIRITSATANDAWFSQEVIVEPDTPYMLTGWIKTENVSSGAGANLSLVGTWIHSAGRFGTTDWTRVSLSFNSGPSNRITIGARLGYWAGVSTGTAWFDDLRLTPIRPDGTYPGWKILVLIYERTDALVTDIDGVQHHMVGAMTEAEVERATLAATNFVETDIPALTSGNMVPELTIRYPEHPLIELTPFGQWWWPSPVNTAADRDPAFDSVIVIWDPRVIDQYTGVSHWIGGAAGLAPAMDAGQTYAAIIIEATGYGHRNVFKHEWGHSILFYFDAIGVAPKPAVTNHSEIGQYVHWPTGESYVWVDETDADPIPNSIYNNESGFTHDYYSGTTATADQPSRRLGITPDAWMWGGPVTKPGMQSSSPVITCNGDITVPGEDGIGWAMLTLTPPTVSDTCESNLIPVATRSDGLPLDAPYACGQTIVTWTVTNSENLTSTCRQVITVGDQKPPTFIQVPPPVIVTTGPGATSCGVFVDDTRLGSTGPDPNPVVLDPAGDVFPATSVPVSGLIALDNCAGVSITRSGVPANNFFPVGETLITYTATDAGGNTASVTQSVTVIDNTPPVISRVVANPSTLWPPNRQMVDVAVSYEAADNCAIAETKLSISTNDPVAASDWEIVDDHHVRLRAERSGRAGPKLYTITITAKDIHGNVSSRHVTVTVPQSHGKGGSK